jgi:thymidylate synthase (FAD)
MIKATYIDHCGSDLTTVNAARVSFDKESDWDITPDQLGTCLSKGDTKLVSYLAKHKHMSPFGHCFASFRVEAPIFVARQLVKHKFLRWNEVSRRYVDSDPVFYFPRVWRGKSEDKKQGSNSGVSISTAYYDRDDGYNTWEDDATSVALEAYQEMLKLGVCPEQARMILPQNTMTEWYWSGSLDAFADMCNLRCKPDTQLETRIVADQISEEMAKLFPVSWKALTEL